MKSILITGASSGIGKVTALHFAKNGWKVAATVRNPAQATDLANVLNLKVYALDVTDTALIKKTVAQVIADFGSLDAVVNNAGYAAVGAFETTSTDQIKRQFDTNVFGLMNVVREVLPHFRARKEGLIINISSVGGQLTFPFYSLYHGTKWAVEGFSESLHYELRPFNIRVKLIEPGAIKTDFYTRSMDFGELTEIHDYEQIQKQSFAKMEAATTKSPGPEVVARAILKAANSRSWKMRHLVGQEGLFVMMKRIIPNSWFFGLIRGATM